MDNCAACGFVYADHGRDVAIPEIAALGRRYRELLEPALERPETLTGHSHPDVWSPLEYACHVRDVLFVQRERLFLTLVEDCPPLRPMYRDERVLLAHYASERPEEVITQIEMAAAMAARAFAGLSDDAWSRECIYQFPTPNRRNLSWLIAHTVHEGDHHFGDIRDQLANA